MSGNLLTLKPLPWVVLAYVVAPVVAIAFLVGSMPVLMSLGGPFDIRSLIGPMILFLIYGLPVAVLFELVVLTPLLFGYRHFRWRWLNGWTGAALAFAIIAMAWILLTLVAAQATIITTATWLGLLGMAAWMGSAAAAGAVTFRLIAVRREPG